MAVCQDTRADIVWSGGTNTVAPDTTQQDNHIVITGGTNTVQGAAGPPAGTNAGVLQLNAGGGGLEITGATLTLNSDATKPGVLMLQGNFASHASSTTSAVATGGAAAVPGTHNLSSGTRTFTTDPGSVPGAGPDLNIMARISNGGLTKSGTGILALGGANTYTGGTVVNAGTLYINSATALGTGDLTIGGSGVSIDNRSGGPLTLTNNNSLNLTGGDLTFIGTNNLNFGTGFSVIANAASRAINIVNSSATLTLGGSIGDNGQNVALVKMGAGTLTLSGDTLYTGGTTVNNGTLQLTGSTNSGVSVSAGATFANNGSVSGNVSVSGLMTGAGTIHGSLAINNGGGVQVNGGTLTVDGAVTNNGLVILSSGAQIGGLTGFVNNGTLDLTTAGPFNPPNFTNNGTIIDSSVVKTKTVNKAGNTVTITIDSFTGHTYQLQKSATSPAANTFSSIGLAQQGSTGNVLTFTDSNATGTKSFYRVVVDP
jgi:autotransporter-associated beta strand protein